jgi:hypothetical protein
VSRAGLFNGSGGQETGVGARWDDGAYWIVPGRTGT